MIKTVSTINKKVIYAGLVLLLLTISFAIVHKVYAGKPTVSLNSPASFPVDI